MSLSIYEVSIPVIMKNLKTLSLFLEKGQEFCVEKKIDEIALVNTRLFPNMLPLKSQIQIATDIVRNGFFRVLNDNSPSFKDDEKDFNHLQKRIKENIIILGDLDSERIVKLQNEIIEFKIGENELKFINLKEYIFSWIFPNFFFHMTTSYNILRSVGVNLGKKDFLS